jgi:hypothetical protein
MAVWHGSDRRVVMYACDSNRLLNLACIHPDTESQGGTDGKAQPNITVGTEVSHCFRMEQRCFFGTAIESLGEISS